MKMLHKVFALVCLLAAVPAMAQEPAGRTRHNPIAVFVREYAHHAKAVVTDLKHDKEWRALVFASVGAQTADLVSTCQGFNHGLYEANPLYGGTNNCAKVAIGSAAMEFSILVADHAFVSWFKDLCKSDENGPHADWTRRYSGSNSCKHAMWVIAPQITVNAVSAYGNECLMGGGCHSYTPAAKRPNAILPEAIRRK